MHNTDKFDTFTEDSVECLFFSFSPGSNNEYWENLCENLNKTIKKLSQGFIWHKEDFKIFIPILKKDPGVPTHLKSIVCFGDNVEDEWFIVYLVLEISKLYTDLIIQLNDSDGEFLLIEAADSLPSWANPETTENRVFIMNNCLHLIPTSIVDIDTKLTQSDALKVIIQSSHETRAPVEIQQAIRNRICKYPDKISENFHRAIVELPIDIAALLTLKPTLISPFVTTYCNHDIIDAKSCKNFAFDNCINVEVKFTKCLYAMLTHSRLLKYGKYRVSDIEKDKKKNLGIKLTCAYQIIMNRISTDIFASKQFNDFKRNLTNNGYFKSNLEGSKDYNELLEKAKYYFINMDCPLNTQVSYDISQLMCTDEFKNLKQSLTNEQPSEFSLIEDSDDWLNVDPEQLNDFLNTHYGKENKFKSGDIITSQTVTSELTNFLKQTSDFEGIELDRSQESNNIEFNSDEFVNSLEKMLNFISSGQKSDDELSDYDDESYNEDEKMAQMNSQIEKEVQDKCNDLQKDNSGVLKNIIQSIKEEQGSSGPSSNLLKSIGINKTDLLDSDDD